MDILTQLEQDLVLALKAKDELTVLVLRSLKTALSNAQIANDRQSLSPEQVSKLLRAEAKKRKESAQIYEQGGRAELAKKELDELAILAKYLPAETSDADIQVVIDATVAELQAKGECEMGKVMSTVMQKMQGSADGSTVNRLVKETLNRL